MTLTTSSNRSVNEWKETYLWSLKKSRGMTALLALLMFMALPMILMIAMANIRNNTDVAYTASMRADSYRQYVGSMTSFLATPLTLIFVLIFAVLLFSYLHQKRSVDLFHSLPVGRVPMLLGRWCAGITSIFAPILLNYAIAFIVGAAYGIDVQFSFAAVAGCMLWLMLMSTAALTFSVFMAVCTGTTFDMVISIFGINAGYPLMVFLGGTCASMLLPGLNIDFSLNSTVLTALAPFIAAFMPYVHNNALMNGQNGPFLAWWIIFTLTLFAGSILLYKKRKSECAESGFAFPIPKVVIRFMVTAAAGLGLGMLLHTSTSVSSSFNFFIGVISGSLAAHIIVEAVYSRGFKQMRHSFSWYGIFLAAFLVLYGVLATGFFGYDTRVPSADDIESITVDVPNQSYNGNDGIYDANYHNQIARITPVLKDRENINKALEFHKEFLAANRSSAYPYSMIKMDTSPLTIEYHLKNGAVLKRSYSQSYSANGTEATKNSFNAMTNGIGGIEEYMKGSDILFYLEPEYIKSVDIGIREENLTIVPDEAQKTELLEALKQDFLNRQVNNPNVDLKESYKKSYRSVIIECKENMTPSGRLKELLGDYSGTVNLGSKGYDLSDGSTQTNALIQKYGWDK